MTFKSCSVSSSKTNTCRNNLLACRFSYVLSGSLIVRAIEMIDVHQNSGFHAEARVKGFKAFQSSRICFKYSEKQIGFSHRNLYNLHLLSNSSPAKT